MANFSDHSRSELSTVHVDLRTICEAVIDAYDFKVLEGHRSKKRQNRLYEQGKSQLQWPESAHNEKPAKAVDLAPWPVEWKKHDRFYHLAGHMEMAAYRLLRRGEISHQLRWGGDWDSDQDLDDQAFDDLPHFELV